MGACAARRWVLCYEKKIGWLHGGGRKQCGLEMSALKGEIGQIYQYLRHDASVVKIIPTEYGHQPQKNATYIL